MDVGAWLRGLGLGRYEQAFRDNAVDGDALPSLTAEDLKELGVAAIGHRRRLLDAIAALRVGAGPGRAPARHPKVELEGERRQVTVLFADLAGYTALSSELDAEEVHALLGRFFERVDRAVEEHGGRVDKHIGDCVMAVFGAPVAHDNDAERAVRAALAIRDAMPALSAEVGLDLRVHVGVAGGQVVASDTGSASHREYTVTGPSVNLASRLVDAAQAGEALVSDAVRRALGERLACDELSPLDVKGFAEPVRAWRLRGLRTPPSRGPLVGRATELGRFRAALADCCASGRGRAVHVRGEAGIGKTRLVEEFQKEARKVSFACHTGLTLDFGAGAGQGAIRALVLGMLGLEAASGAGGAISAVAGGLDESLARAENAVFLNDLLGFLQPAALRPLYDAMDNAARAHGRQQTLTRLVERSSRAQPRLLVVEDLHWADRLTLTDVATLAAAVSRCRAILVTTSRVEGDPLSPRWWAEVTADKPLTIELGPLDTAGARALAGPFLAANASLAERCIERAAGNPLFLEHLLRHAEESLGSAVPDSVQSVVQAKVDRLDPTDRATLQAASVLGQRFDLEALRHILGQPGCSVERLTEHLLIRSEGESFLFTHALVRDAIYDSVLRSRRRDLHRRAAGWYEGRDPALRAEHLDRANDPGAARAYLAAAQAQVADYRYELALRLAERGLELAGGQAERFALGCLRADILHNLGQMQAALSAYEGALVDVSGDAERCQALIGLAAVKRVTDDHGRANEALGEAEALALAHDLVTELARIHYLRGCLRFPQGDLDGCLREHELALGYARRAGAPEIEAQALSGLGDAEYGRGRMVSAHDRFRRCVALCREHGLGRIEVANLGAAALTRLYLNEPRGAAGDLLAAIEAALRVGNRRAELVLRLDAALVLWELGEADRVRGQVGRSMALAHALGARRFEAEGLLLEARLLRDEGHRSEALRLLDRAMTVSRETGIGYLGAAIAGEIAVIAETGDVRGRALAQGEAILAAGAVSHNHLWFHRRAMEAALSARDWAAVERHAAALERYTRSEPLPWADFFVARGRALAAHGRGSRGVAPAVELARLRDEAERIGLKSALPLLEAALAMT